MADEDSTRTKPNPEDTFVIEYWGSFKNGVLVDVGAMPFASQPPPGRPSTVFKPIETALAYVSCRYGWPYPRPTFSPLGQQLLSRASWSLERPDGQAHTKVFLSIRGGVTGSGDADRERSSRRGRASSLSLCSALIVRFILTPPSREKMFGRFAWIGALLSAAERSSASAIKSDSRYQSLFWVFPCTFWFFWSSLT